LLINKTLLKQAEEKCLYCLWKWEFIE